MCHRYQAHCERRNRTSPLPAAFVRRLGLFRVVHSNGQHAPVPFLSIVQSAGLTELLDPAYCAAKSFLRGMRLKVAFSEGGFSVLLIVPGQDAAQVVDTGLVCVRAVT